MDVWMPYGEVEVSVEVADGSLVELLEPKLPGSADWIEDFMDTIGGDVTVGLDPVLIGLGGVNLVNKLSSALREGGLGGQVKIVLASNLYPMPLDIDGYLEGSDLKVEPWRGDTTPDVILAALLPHPLLGFCGAPHVACLGRIEFPGLLNDPGLVEGVKAESLEDNPVTASILERVDSSPYAFHFIPYRGDLIPMGKGGLAEAFREGVRGYIESFKVIGDRPILVVSVGGYPFDASILNAIHTLRVIGRTVVDGGELIILSECGGVLTDPYLLRSLMGLSPRGVRDPLAEDLKSVISKVTDRISVRLVSILPNSYARRIGFKPADTAAAAFQSATRRVRDAKASFLSWGYYAVT